QLLHAGVLGTRTAGERSAAAGERPRSVRVRAQVATAALGLAIGWNISNIGAVADETAHAYGITLGVVGLFTTVLFVVHSLMQVPSGSVVDRFGSRRSMVVAVLCLLAANAVAA